MAEVLAGLGPMMDSLLGHLGIHGVSRLDVGVWFFGATVFLGFCAAAHSAARIAFCRYSVRK